MNHRAFDNVDLNLIAKIVKNFVNPTFEAIQYTLDKQIVFDPSPATKVINEVLGIDGYVIIDDPQSLTFFDEAIKSSKHISVQLGKALPDSECKRIGCPVKSATVLVECDNVKERFLIAPGLKKQEEFAISDKSILYYIGTRSETQPTLIQWMKPGRENWDGQHYEILDLIEKRSEAGTSTVIDSDFRSRLLKSYANVRFIL